MARADFGTKSTIETRRTILVAIYAMCPGPTFLDRENVSILQELTILHLEKKKIDKCQKILNEILFTNTGIANDSIMLTAL